ncbi:MAG: endonuclease/exonuclease/phosphatase family protein [Bacteroidetes bacterium]|nr:endonuclease/exonuclease/phosphatase family protein [Bacteroidota bacterium]
MSKKKAQKRYSLITKVILVVNVIFALLLLFSYLAPYIDPRNFVLLAFIGLSYGILLIINMLFILFWMVRGRWMFFLSAIVILIGINPFLNQVQFNFKKIAVDGKQQKISILSYNLHLFDVFEKNGKEETRNKIFSFLRNSDADIFCFQEFYNNDQLFPVVDSLKKLLNTPYFHVDYVNSSLKGNQFGFAFFSKYPIITSNRFISPDGHTFFSVFTDIQWNNDTIRVFNNHLESIRFSQKDYSFYSELTKNPSEHKDVKEGSVSILHKLLHAFQKRAQQASQLRDYIKTSPHPVIVCGDFNDTPLSFTYHQISGDLSDAFRQCGLGLGSTYAGIFPSFRIDYILFDPCFKAVKYNNYRKNYSDHYPISATLVINYK